ncbi:MAG: hypothetical protein HN417_10735 [Desulfobacula sp.]|jgi:hypothetical protein|nr:hypothetical protein [Desulfobacula sp.]
MPKEKPPYDTPWKKIIEVFFNEFMSFFVPDSEKDIDKEAGVKFLDKELQSITKQSESGQRTTDKLIEVTLNDETKKWILIHIEVQASQDTNFSKRMFMYNYRIYDRYEIPVTSIAILADDSPSWNPAPFEYGMWGAHMQLKYLKVKLLDYKDKWNYLKDNHNPFAIVVMAHIKALETRKDNSLRKQWKIELTKLLYEKSYSKSEILELYAFIDWALSLPFAFEEKFLEELKEYEEDKNMPYITSAERIGIYKGRREGRKQEIISLIHNAHKQGLNEDMIARITNMDPLFVRSIINKEEIDIPLHLLDS